MNFHEEQFARCFILPQKQDRYLTLLESKRGRTKLLNGFYHCRDLDPRFAKQIPSGEQFPESIEALLKKKGAPGTCYVMSTNSEIDGREMDLAVALQETDFNGTLISCLPGKLAYFEMEEMKERFILER